MYSIIIPTYNRINYLKKCLESLENLKISKDFEIIVVNDASKDGTYKFLEEIKSDKIKVINHKINQGPSVSRNNGIELSQGEIILFIDDDCIAHSDWLLEIEKTFNDPGVKWTFGKVIYGSENYKGYFPERIVENRGSWPMGANLAFRKEVLEKEKFNPTFDMFHNEDTELALRILKKYKLKKSTNAIVYHQKMLWNKASLLSSARNQSIWPVLKKKYQKDIYKFLKPPISFGVFVSPQDYLFLFFAVFLIPMLFIRYLLNGNRNIKIFFLKWPVFFILKRFYIVKESFKNKIFLV